MIGHTVVAEILAQAGFDFVCVDTEHGAIDLETTQQLLQAIRAGNPACVPFVRLPGSNRVDVAARYLDAGAMGIIIPHVNTAEDARNAVKAIKYPPEGERGVGLSRAQLWGARFDEYMAEANRRTRIVVMAEHKEAIVNIDAIVEVPGIDAVFMGPYDLSASMGVPGQVDHPQVRAAISTVLAACNRSGVIPGIHVVSPDPGRALELMQQGFRFIAYSLDTLMLRQTAEAGVSALRGKDSERRDD